LKRTAYSIEWNGWQYEVDGDILSATRNGVTQVELDLRPVIEGVQTSIIRWSQESDGSITGVLSTGDTVRLGVREGYVAYWMETKTPHFELLTFFPQTTFNGDHWQTFVSDCHDRLWEKRLDSEVLASSAYDDIMNVDGADGAGLTDPGDFPPTFVWNMPVRSFVFQTEADWFGVTIPGPLPVGVTRLKMCEEKFSLTFQVLHPRGPEGSMPVVYFVTGMTEVEDVLDADRVISERLGLTVKKSADHPHWWTLPGLKPYLEHSRRAAESGNSDWSAQQTPERILEWANTQKADSALDEMYVIFEQGSYRYYGDYTPTDAMGGIEGFRKMVDQLRTENVRVHYYIHPFMVNTKIDYYREHPEAFCKAKETGHQTLYACEHGDEAPEFALVDWTHPLGRKFILDQVKMILSDESGSLNCDWLRSNHWRSPDPRVYDFHDPDWGIGDLMSMKVQKLLYETAKSVKPDCCVSKVAFAAPYMQPYADVNLLSEEWNGWTDNWYKRARIVTRTIKDTAFIFDPYFLTITKSYEYFMGGIAPWCIMEDPIVKHAIHPYLYFRELKEKDFKRRKAGIHTHLNAPINVTDECLVRPAANGQAAIWRKRTTGKLAGWYAALAFGKRCFATYSETQALIAASETRLIDLPLPPGAVVKSVQMIPHDGPAQNCQAEPCVTDDGPGLRIRIEDCGFVPMYYRVEYTLQFQVQSSKESVI